MQKTIALTIQENESSKFIVVLAVSAMVTAISFLVLVLTRAMPDDGRLALEFFPSVGNLFQSAGWLIGTGIFLEFIGIGKSYDSEQPSFGRKIIFVGIFPALVGISLSIAQYPFIWVIASVILMPIIGSAACLFCMQKFSNKDGALMLNGSAIMISVISLLVFIGWGYAVYGYAHPFG